MPSAGAGGWRWRRRARVVVSGVADEEQFAGRLGDQRGEHRAGDAGVGAGGVRPGPDHLDDRGLCRMAPGLPTGPGPPGATPSGPPTPAADSYAPDRLRPGRGSAVTRAAGCVGRLRGPFQRCPRPRLASWGRRPASRCSSEPVEPPLRRRRGDGAHQCAIVVSAGAHARSPPSCSLRAMRSVSCLSGLAG